MSNKTYPRPTAAAERPAMRDSMKPKAKKALGQNFLINPGIAPKMIEESGLTADFGVLEIGPGLGALTKELAPRARKVAAIELDADVIPELRRNLAEVAGTVSIIKGDVMRLDLALLLDKAVRFEDLDRIIRKNAGKLLQDVTLFDVYEGKNLPAGKKSYAVAIILRDDEKTLKDKQIDAVMQKVTSALSKELGASLR